MPITCSSTLPLQTSSTCFHLLPRSPLRCWMWLSLSIVSTQRWEKPGQLEWATSSRARYSCWPLLKRSDFIPSWGLLQPSLLSGCWESCEHKDLLFERIDLREVAHLSYHSHSPELVAFTMCFQPLYGVFGLLSNTRLVLLCLLYLVIGWSLWRFHYVIQC